MSVSRMGTLCVLKRALLAETVHVLCVNVVNCLVCDILPQVAHVVDPLLEMTEHLVLDHCVWA